MSFWCLRWTEQSRSPRKSTFAVVVEEDLRLDMSGSLQVLLDVDLGIPEVGVGLAAGTFE